MQGAVCKTMFSSLCLSRKPEILNVQWEVVGSLCSTQPIFSGSDVEHSLNPFIFYDLSLILVTNQFYVVLSSGFVYYRNENFYIFHVFCKWSYALVMVIFK